MLELSKAFQSPFWRLAKFWSLGVLGVALIVNVNGCSGGGPPGGRAQWGGPVAVLVAPSIQKTVPVQLHAIGTVDAYASVAVKPQVGGQIIGVYFQQGQQVAQDQRLFDIDPRPYRAALDQARATLARDQAQSEQASRDAARWQALYQSRTASQQQAEQAQAQAAELKAAVEADKANVKTAQLNLEFCRILSPIAGRAGALMVQAGNIIKANPDNPIVTINQIKPIYVQFSLPEKELPLIRRYMNRDPLTVEVYPPSAPDQVSTGALDFIDNSVDTTTGTIQFRGLFQNRDEALWPGEFVNVTLTLTERPNTVLVPSQAVQSGEQGNYVYVLKPDQTVRLQPVVIGDTLSGMTIIQRGLHGGETVVTDGQVQLVPGARVRIKSGLGPAHAGAT
ncbi:MAG TPA: efflux RND transporter periplasmic adaptor subunit [Candidatus Binataceae bacterium]|nr:efflux RND transporter periplasmic adaptor subunit [Candidatus Binataceae bacterium]